METRQLKQMNTTLFGLVLLISLGTMSVARAATTLTLSNNAVTDSNGSNYSLSSGVYNAGGFVPVAGSKNSQFGTDREYRMIAPDGQIGGGGEKSLVGARDQPPFGSCGQPAGR